MLDKIVFFRAISDVGMQTMLDCKVCMDKANLANRLCESTDLYLSVVLSQTMNALLLVLKSFIGS